ncbi:alpha/beta fold hydrolase [Companilactobacillus musae]|uniref:alpha/beta hydrolase family protein n=1 Tax=Companilactobacillus musae TaxID=1903258 RepID=UPI000E65EB43|nr:alpha/beta fold hydrolase [Companilactobacillus musae]
MRKTVISVLLLVGMLMIAGCSKKDVSANNKGPSAGKVANTKTKSVNDQVWHVKYNNEDIYGHIYTAKNHPKKMPIAIVSHGLGGNYQELESYAKNLANQGYLAYSFDFPGGSYNGRSTGIKQIQMSIITEEQDLLAVKEALQKRDDVLKHRVLLVGGSQGGVVSALTASNHPQDIEGLALMYPAFSITRDAQEQYSSFDQVPKTNDLMGFTVGRNYYKELLNMDITNTATKYKGPVLIVHGNSDDIVSIKYPRQAAHNFKNAHFIVLKNAGHGFYGKDLKLALKDLDEFVKSKK